MAHKSKKKKGVGKAGKAGRGRGYWLLDNAFDFLSDAAGRLEKGASLSDAKYAVLHLAAGVELLLKEQLRREHWALLFSKPDNASLQAYKAGDFLSVTFDQTIQRLAGISGVKMPRQAIETFRHLRQRRNCLEHFQTIDSPEALRSTCARAFSVVFDMLQSVADGHLRADQEKQVEGMKKSLLATKHFVRERLKSLESELKARRTKGEETLTCPRCDQVTLPAEASPVCLFCGNKVPGEDVASAYAEAVDDALVTGPCPECGATALVVSSSDGRAGQCFRCGNEFSALNDCSRCGGLYEEMTDDDIGICNDCWQQVIAD
jgi:hypothetical protein